MKFVIVDDDKFFRERVAELLRGAPGWSDAEIILCGFDGAAATDIADDDVIFLDIADGSDENAGIKLAHRLRRTNANAHIVFVTSYNDKVRDTLTGLIRPSEFLVKPLLGVEKEKLYEFLKALRNARPSRLHLKIGTKQFDVVIDDILYVHRNDRKTEIYTKNSFFQVRQSLSAIVDMLDENFIVVDKGTAVNIKRAQSYDSSNRLIRMENGTDIYCSRDKARLFRDILTGLEVTGYD